MAIAEGLSAATAGFKLIQGALELLKREHVDPQDVAARLLELQGLLIQTRQALVDAQEDNRNLQATLTDDKRQQEIESDLNMEPDGQFLVRQSERAQGKNIPYCPVCWGESHKLIALAPGNGTRGTYHCVVHKHTYTTQEHRDALRASTQRLAQHTPKSPWS